MCLHPNVHVAYLLIGQAAPQESSQVQTSPSLYSSSSLLELCTTTFPLQHSPAPCTWPPFWPQCWHCSFWIHKSTRSGDVYLAATAVDSRSNSPFSDQFVSIAGLLALPVLRKKHQVHNKLLLIVTKHKVTV